MIIKLTCHLRRRMPYNFTHPVQVALNREGVEYISVDRLIQQPSLDPDYVSVGDYVETRSSGGAFGANDTTPPKLAGILEEDCLEALRLVEDIDTSGDPSFMYEVSDVKAWANLGLHFAEKLKGAVALQTYRTEGGEENKRNAVEHLEKALGFWDEVISITRPIYKDMPLVHYNRRGDDRNDNLFHWQLIRSEVANDIEIARNATASTTGK
ncbi:hypothetical protein NC796_07945 [Aliifodinibius sp. S!AR15-10]|uniref:hypothetical protein n=1 Tax=Aliifodinibius sp. S!AR15-10 TaxID=2950437 RepID=UPI00286580EB|nr:hypothetical protein [Aliifodinibius sp. S!AR15-10]MDR8391065.1 hypothetical protein [Aliifodinibius sp. S!AR15-10]